MRRYPDIRLHRAEQRARWREGNILEAMGQKQRPMSIKMMKNRRQQHQSWHSAHSYSDWMHSVPGMVDFSGLQTSLDHNPRKCAPLPTSFPHAAAKNHGHRPWSIFMEMECSPGTLPLWWWSSATLVLYQILLSTCIHTTQQTGGCP